jgi:hypothetical protein
MRQIEKLEAEETAAKEAASELVHAAQLLVTRVKLDLLPKKHIGWGGGVIERVEGAIARIENSRG